MSCNQTAAIANQAIEKNGGCLQKIEDIEVNLKPSSLPAGEDIRNENCFKIDRSYPKSVARRQRNSREELDRNYLEVDQAICSPVKILNENFGLGTSASCEGHYEDYSQFVLKMGGSPTRKKLTPPMDSYIMARSYPFSPAQLTSFLQKKGFGVASYYNSQNNRFSFDSFFLDFPEGGSLSCEFAQRERGEIHFTLRVNTKGYGNKTRNNNFRDSLSQRDWDQFRDDGWDKWLEILQEFYTQEKISVSEPELTMS